LSESAHQTVVSIKQANSAIDSLNDAAHMLQAAVSKFTIRKAELN